MTAQSNTRIIFIAGLGHSGSTMLDLVLGGHGRFVGLGEVAAAVATGAVIDADGGPPCSCGRAAAACPFWRDVDDRLRAEPGASPARRYAIAFEAFAAVFGRERVPVDSSKYLDHLRLLHGELGFDVRVLFILKDVRNFTVSTIDNVARKRAGGSRRRSVTPLGTFREWHRKNRALREYLERERLPVFQFGYEEFCLGPEPMARRICEFLEVPYSPDMLRLRESDSHVLRGNRMRFQPEKSALAYDHRWFTRRDWLLPSLLCPRVMRFNREQVYSNGLVRTWER